MHPMLTIASRAARAAAAEITQAFARPDRVKVHEKRPNDFVTDVDKAVEETLIYHLRQSYPQHGFLCEESGRQEGEDQNALWLIDPIDGTRNFIRGFPHFCISMAYTENNILQHALILDPMRDEEFTASKGRGARLNGQRLRVGERVSLNGATVSFSCAGRRHYDTLLALKRELKGRVGATRMMGSVALDLAYNAAGRTDAGWIAGMKSWDAAAGILLIREAGGLISDCAGNPACLDSDSMVFANGKCFSQLLKLVASVQRPKAAS